MKITTYGMSRNSTGYKYDYEYPQNLDITNILIFKFLRISKLNLK